MSTLPIDLRLALRGLRRSPAFAAAVMLTLSLGIGVASGIFSVASALLWRPLPFNEPDRLVHIWSTDTRAGLNRVEVSPLDYRDWREELRTLAGLGAFRLNQFYAGHGATAERVHGAHVSADLIELLGSTPMLGRTFTPEEEARNERVVLISASLWHQQFGGARSVLGQPLRLDGVPYTIIGVMDDRFVFPIPTTSLWIPLQIPAEQANRRAGTLRVVARLAPDATLASAQRELETVAARQSQDYPETNAARAARIVPLREGLMFAFDRVVMLSNVLLGASAFVLLLVYANVANLMVARLLAVEHQIAIRSALGATRVTRITPMLAEAVLLVVGGGVGGLLIASWIGKTLGAAIPEQIYRVGTFGLSWDTVLLTLALCVCTLLVVAVWPAVRARVGAVSDTLRDRRSMSPSLGTRRRFDVLATAQIAIATVLLAGALLMARTLQSLSSVDPGFEADQVLTLEFSMPPAQYDSRDRIARFVSDVLEGAAGAPGISSAAVVNFLPFNNEHRAREFVVAGVDQPGAAPKSAIELVISDGYFRTMGVAMIAGRDFERSDDTSTAPVAIVNETFVRQRLAGRDPIGARVYVPRPQGDPVERVIVGVTADTKHVDVSGPPPPLVYVPFFQEPWAYFRLIARTTGEPAAAVPALKTIIAGVDPYVAASRIRTLHEVMTASVLPQRLIAGTLTGLAAGALLLVLVGVYGVVAYVVSLRSHEFAVRLALGADRANVRRLVLVRSVKLSAIGVTLGVATALTVGRALEQFLYGTRVDDHAILLGVVAVIAAVTLLASYVPARRASQISPSETLRAQ